MAQSTNVRVSRCQKVFMLMRTAFSSSNDHRFAKEKCASPIFLNNWEE